MSIFVDRESKIIVQGITGKYGSYHTMLMQGYGSKIVAGVTPGKAGFRQSEVPVFDTVKQAKDATGANVSVIFVPAAHAPEAIFEAFDAELDLVVCITEHIPVLDMIKIVRETRGAKTLLIGPNCPGIITPGQTKIGIMPGSIHMPGHTGVVSRSGTLTYEVVKALTEKGIGQSTVLGVGGDPVHGIGFIETLQAFNDDADTDSVVIIGEIGGEDEERAAEWVGKNMRKPVVGFIAGQSAPAGRRMGHAGAVISGKRGTAKSKLEAFNANHISCADKISQIPEILLRLKEG